MKKPISAILCILLAAMPSLAQDEAPSHEKTHYVDQEGKLYWNKELPIYLRISSTPDGKGELLPSERTKEYANPGYLDTEGINYIRTKHAVDPETKRIVSPQIEIMWEVYADGLTPSTDADFTGAMRYAARDTVFYGPNLVASLTSQDATSGVKQIYYANGQKKYAAYSGNIALDTEGPQELKFYAVDHVGNAEQPTTKPFVVDLTPPETIYNFNGIADGIISTRTIIYLLTSDNLSGVSKTYYRFNNEEYKVYNGKSIPFDYLPDGEHTLSVYSEDNVGNKETAVSADFYLDKTAPITAADVLGDRFVVDGKVYFSGRTKMKLTAVDNKSGVKDVLYSINGEEFQSYKEPFYMPSRAGEHVIRYFSVDHADNVSDSDASSARYQEFKHNVSKVYVDLTGPTLSHNYAGKTFQARDTLFINEQTLLQLSAKDGESGLQYVSYSIDGALEETKYQSPFSVKGGGVHQIEMFGYDNVNNRNISKFFVYVDNNPPDIYQYFSISPIAEREGLPVYPSYATLYLAATDRETGTDKIFYTLNGGAEKTYAGTITGFKKGEKNTVKLRALDKLDNEKIVEVQFFID